MSRLGEFLRDVIVGWDLAIMAAFFPVYVVRCLRNQEAELKSLQKHYDDTLNGGLRDGGLRG